MEQSTQKLTSDLTAALGDQLVSLMLYGSAARGTASPGYSDVNVLLVLRETSADVLHRASPALAAWRKAGNAPPLIQTEAEWTASADVFPIEIEDIREAHTLLAGRDVVSGITTARADLRAELEREARGKLIRLRAEYAATAADGRVLAELLARATGTFLVLFRASLRLANRPIPKEPAELIRAAAGVAGFKASAFDGAVAARKAGKAAALGAYDAVATEYLVAVETFVSSVNKLQ